MSSLSQTATPFLDSPGVPSASKDPRARVQRLPKEPFETMHVLGQTNPGRVLAASPWRTAGSRANF